MRNVVITGLGMVSPIGNNVTENWDAIHAGACGIAPITHFDCSNQKVKVAGEIKNLNLEDYFSKKEVKRMDRFVALALIAAKEAMAQSGLLETTDWNHDRAGTIIATGVGGLTTIECEHEKCLTKGSHRISPYFVPAAISNIAAAKIAIEYQLHGMSSCTITACAGGANAIGDGFRQIRDGYSDIMICGGSESCISEFGIGGFAALNALSTTQDPNRASIPFDKERNGFVMGEGAGILVLEEKEHAKKRGATILCELVGYGVNCDAYHVTAPCPDGSGATKCMQQALEDAGLTYSDINYINAHGTSTPLNDSSETLAIKHTFKEHANHVFVSSTKSFTGHLLGASGAIEAIYSALSVRDDYCPATIHYQVPDEACDCNLVKNNGIHTTVTYAMSNSLGFGGHNASLIFKKAE